MAIAHATKTRGQKRARQEEALKNMVADGAQRCMTAVHATPHIPSAWGGFHRLRPNNIPFATMQKLAACNFQPKKTHLAPHLLGGYKDSYETALFLSHQACRKLAWPKVNTELMYDVVMSSNYVTYMHRNSDGEIDAAATLKIRSYQGLKYCWIEFIRALAPVGSKAQKDRPVPRFMDALDMKVGPLYDCVLLQVHKNNKHAVKRFKERYGFRHDKEWDDKASHLLGMLKEATGPALEEAKVRRRIESEQREEATKRRREREAADMKKLMEDGSKRPRRESVRTIDYCFPNEFKIVAARDLLPNWAASSRVPGKSGQDRAKRILTL